MDTMTEDNVTAVREAAEQVHDIFKPILNTERTMLPPVSDDTVIDLMRVFSLHRPDLRTSSAVQVAVCQKFCLLAPRLGLIRVEHDPQHAEFHWAAMRCLLAGFGHGAHAVATEILTSIYPQCPLVADIEYEAWIKDLHEAHQMCGLPVTLLSIPYHQLRGAVGQDEVRNLRDDPAAWWWLRPVAAVHVIKHTRVEGYHIRARYRGADIMFDSQRTVNIVLQRCRQLGPSLGFTGVGKPKAVVSQAALAEDSISHCITDGDLLGIMPRARAHHLITGPWARCLPDPTRMDGWVQHGLRLEGVYELRGTDVQAAHGSDEDILAYGWEVYIDTPEDRENRIRFDAARPRTVAEEHWPTDYLRAAFPNLVPCSPDVEAQYALIDAVLLVAAARHRLPDASREYPMLWVLPHVAEHSESTNQGKTLFMQLIAQSMTPGIPVVRCPDSSSAPDIRGFCHQWEQFGTVCLDEWRTPRTTNHPLFHDNIQSMITGKSVVIGKVMSNDPRPLRLTQPLVASAKCVSLPPDMVNRSLFLFLRTLTPEERANVDIVSLVETGRLPMLMSLSSRMWAEKLLTDPLLPQAMTTFRFNLHAAMAVRIMTTRYGITGPEAMDRLTKVADAMARRYRIHLGEAERTGLLTAMENPAAQTVRFAHFCENISVAEVSEWSGAFADLCVMRGVQPTDGLPIIDLLRARGLALGIMNPSPGEVYTAITGDRPGLSHAAIVNAITVELKSTLPRPGTVWVLPGDAGVSGWCIERCNPEATNSNQLRVTLAVLKAPRPDADSGG